MLFRRAFEPIKADGGVTFGIAGFEGLIGVGVDGVGLGVAPGVVEGVGTGVVDGAGMVEGVGAVVGLWDGAQLDSTSRIRAIDIKKLENALHGLTEWYVIFLKTTSNSLLTRISCPGYFLSPDSNLYIR